MSKVNYGKAKPHLDLAKKILETKKFITVRQLARKLDITPQISSAILSYLPEWTRYSSRSMNPVYEKVEVIQ